MYRVRWSGAVLWAADVTATQPGAPVEVMAADRGHDHPELSPDGRWVSASGELALRGERGAWTHLHRFRVVHLPTRAEQSLIPPNLDEAGGYSRWSPDGQALVLQVHDRKRKTSEVLLYRALGERLSTPERLLGPAEHTPTVRWQPGPALRVARPD
jgi:hypothetical protein